MTSAIDNHDSRSAPLRVLVAVHGYEPEGWGPETARVLARWSDATVRVLGILEAPCPPVTSPMPGARRAHAAARDAWSRDDRPRLQAALHALAPHLPGSAEVQEVASIEGDAARTVLAAVQTWPADVVVVGPPRRGWRAWLWPGPVHTRLLRRLPCAVLVTPPPMAATPRPFRAPDLTRAVAAPRRA